MFRVDGKEINTNYDRYDSPYIRAKRKSVKMHFTFNDKYLVLDFYNNGREFN